MKEFDGLSGRYRNRKLAGGEWVRHPWGESYEVKRGIRGREVFAMKKPCAKKGGKKKIARAVELIRSGIRPMGKVLLKG
jgi:hypothetical protein